MSRAAQVRAGKSATTYRSGGSELNDVKRKTKTAPVMRSVRAEPSVSEDDFEAETRSEAAHYAAVQANETERERQRQENKLLKEQGLPVKALPRKIKERRKVYAAGNDSSEEEEEVKDRSRSSGGRNRPARRNHAVMKEHARHNMGREDELEYEGQVILPFDPLYALAGLKEEISYSDTVEHEKQKLLDSYFASRERTGDPGPSTTANASKMTMRNGCLVKKEDVKRESPQPPSPIKPVPVSPPMVKQEEPSVEAIDTEHTQAKAEEPDELPEVDYDDEEALAELAASQWPAPASSSIKAEAEDVKPTISQLAGATKEEEYEEAEEGSYSDDDFAMLLPSDPPSTQLTYSQPTQQSLSLAALGPDLPDIKPQFPFNDSQAQVGAYLLDGPAGPAVPAPINKFLKPYQRAGVQFMFDLYKKGRGGILGDDMGLGKTVQVIAFLSAIMRKTGTKMDYNRRKDLIRQGSAGEIAPKHWPTALIVCPSSLVRNWQREFETWGYFEVQVWDKANSADLEVAFRKGYHDVLLASYEQARFTIEKLKEMPFSTVVVDEAHRLKEPRASRTLALKKIQCSACFALTGTLIQNRIEEMWSVLDFTQRGWAGTFRQWREFAVLPIKKGHRLDGTAHDVVMGIMRLGQVHSRILPNFYIRRDKRLIAHELPEKRDLVVFCPLADKQIQAYQRLIDSEDVQFIVRRNEDCDCGSGERRIRCCHEYTDGGEQLRDVVLKNINALSKVANHFGLLYHAKDDPPHMREVNSKIFAICTGRPYQNRQDNAAEAAMDPSNCGKWTLLQELLKQWRSERAKKHKVLIFSNSVRLLRMIEQFISMQFSGFDFAVFTGEASGKDRMRMVDDFQDPDKDHFIMLISTQAGGVGLNLTAANKVVIFDPDWNPANDLQAMDRAFRIGQQRTVEVYRMIGMGTLEELKYERQIHKQQRARQLNDGAFERRIHQGMEGGKTSEDQGELFGTHNIFKFNPNGFVPGNLDRVRAAEDRFAQDLIEAEYDEEDEEEEGLADDEVEAKRLKRERRDMQVRQARRDRLEEKERVENGRKVDDVLGRDEQGGDTAKNGAFQDVLDKIGGAKSHVHDTAFLDSPAERQIYEIGIKLLRDNPELAKTMKANDLGKLGGVKRTRRSSASRDDPSVGETSMTGRTTAGAKRDKTVGEEDDDEPWLKRINKKAKATKLITLSDEE